MRFIQAAVIAAAAAVAAAGAHAEFKDFTVNGQVISKDIQERQAQQVIAGSHTPDVKPNEHLEGQVRDWLIRVTAVAQYAKKNGLDKDKDVKADLRTTADYVLYNAAMADWMKKNPVTEKEMRAVYEKDKAFWGNTEYNIRHIMVKTEKEAQDILAQLKKGGDFKTLADKYSIDEDTAAIGGDLGWQSPSVFTEDFRSVITKLKKGETADKPLKSAGGWHIIRVEGTRKAELFPKFEEKKAEIEQVLMQQKLNQFVENVVKSAKIK